MKAFTKCLRFFFLITLPAQLFTGCAPIAVNPTPVDSPLMIKQAKYEQAYIISAGDQLDIKFFYNSELNESMTVRSDGRISLQLVGELDCVGMSPAQLSTQIKEKFAPILVRPDVTVIVRVSSGYRVFVDGEVKMPGVYDIIGPKTIRHSLAQAGGVLDTARTNEILVIRQRKDQEPLVVAVNLESINSGADFSQNIVLSPYDIVYVPRSPIANADVWVRQYIRDLLPIMPGIGFTFGGGF
jgi:polysaccharide export outer membrane protein